MALKAKSVFIDMYVEHVQKEGSRKRKSRRVSISTDWAESGSTGTRIVEAAAKQETLKKEKKKKLDDERREREDKKKKKARASKRNKARRERERVKKKVQTAHNKKLSKEKRKEAEKTRLKMIKKHAEIAAEKKMMNAHKCKVRGCKRRWSEGSVQCDQWLWCGECNFFGICFVHVKDDEHLQALNVHEGGCGK